MHEWPADPTIGFPPDQWATTHADERTLLLKRRLLGAERWLDVESARFTTRSYQAGEGQPMPVRRARMLLDVVRQMSIAINQDELIVGTRSLLPRMGVVAPEGAVTWVDPELDILPTRPQDRFQVSREQVRELREEVFPYWRGKTLEDTVAASIPEDVRRAVEGKAFSLNQTDYAQGNILPDVENWLRLGIGGLRAQVAAARAQADAQSPAQQVFYESADIALQAAGEFVSRYAALAESLAGAPEGDLPPGRRAELLATADTCRRLARQAARDFREALQTVWFLFVLLQIESNASSFSSGRLDQYLLPYLEADLVAGRLTLRGAQATLEQSWLKFNEIVLLRSSASARYFAGFPIGFNVLIGGQLPDGRDATNLLSYMCLRAQVELLLTQPNLSLRVQRDSPQELLRAAAFVIGKGTRMPQIFNDEVILPGQLRLGIDRQDALNYAVVGCVELSVPGKALGWSDSAMFNMARILELTLFGGRDPHTGRQIGLATPPLDKMTVFSELEAAYQAQLAHFVRLMVKGCDIVDRIHAEMLPSPFLSCVVQDCVERGQDVTAGGAHYNFSGPQGVQVANLADSLAAVRQAVFEESWLPAAGLLEALRDDFAGQEALRQRLVNRAPKYGNYDDRVDADAARWADCYSELVGLYPTVRGGTYQPGFYTVSAHVPMGANVGATPDGRRAGQPLADGGLSPFTGRDHRGATAVLKSVSKLNLELASNGTLLNMKFLPSFFAGPGALDKFVLLLRGFCALKIPHIQFNVVVAETLRRAQARPEDYPSLVVRVAGYSAYFTELDRGLQDEIIARTEYVDAA